MNKNDVRVYIDKEDVVDIISICLEESQQKEILEMVNNDKLVMVGIFSSEIDKRIYMLYKAGSHNTLIQADTIDAFYNYMELLLNKESMINTEVYHIIKDQYDKFMSNYNSI